MSMKKLSPKEGFDLIAAGELVPLTTPRESAVDLLEAIYKLPTVDPTLAGFCLAVAEALQAANKLAEKHGKETVWPSFTPKQMIAKIAGSVGVPASMLQAVADGTEKCPGCGEYHGPHGSNGEPASAADQYVDEMEALLKGMPASATKH